jgi:hypothetical protein
VSGLSFKLRVLRYLLRASFDEWRDTVWRKDPDSQYCCDGRECCCGGETIEEMWSWHLNPPASPTTLPTEARHV